MTISTQSSALFPTLDGRLARNAEWAESIQTHTPDYFKELVKGQQPEILWFGCKSNIFFFQPHRSNIIVIQAPTVGFPNPLFWAELNRGRSLFIGTLLIPSERPILVVMPSWNTVWVISVSNTVSVTLHHRRNN